MASRFEREGKEGVPKRPPSPGYQLSLKDIDGQLSPKSVSSNLHFDRGSVNDLKPKKHTRSHKLDFEEALRDLSSHDAPPGKIAEPFAPTQANSATKQIALDPPQADNIWNTKYGNIKSTAPSKDLFSHSTPPSGKITDSFGPTQTNSATKQTASNLPQTNNLWNFRGGDVRSRAASKDLFSHNALPGKITNPFSQMQIDSAAKQPTLISPQVNEGWNIKDSHVTSVALSGDSGLIVTGSLDRTARIWDASNGHCLRTLKGHRNHITSVTVSRDSRWIITGSWDNTAKIWDAANGSCLQTLQGHGDSVTSVAISGDSRWIVTGSFDKTAKIWDVSNGHCLRTLDGHGNSIRSVIVSGNSDRIVTGSWDNTAKIWDATSGSCLKTLEGHSDCVTSLAVSGDSRWIVTGSFDRTVKIWDVIGGSCLQTLNGHSDSITSAVISDDSCLIVTGSFDKTAKIWDFSNGRCLKTLKGHSDSVTSVAVSRNSHWIVTGSLDNTARIWDAANGSCLRVLECHSDHVASVLESDDLRWSLTGSEDDIANNKPDKATEIIGKGWNMQTGKTDKQPTQIYNFRKGHQLQPSTQQTSSLSREKSVAVSTISEPCLKSLGMVSSPQKSQLPPQALFNFALPANRSLASKHAQIEAYLNPKNSMYSGSDLPADRDDEIGDIDDSLSTSSSRSESLPSSSHEDIDDYLTDQLLRTYLNDVLCDISLRFRPASDDNDTNPHSSCKNKDEQQTIPATSVAANSSSKGQKRIRGDAGESYIASGHDKNNEGEESSNEDDGQRKRQKGSRALVQDRVSALKLACPFYKKTPQRYQTCRPCRGPGWDTAHRVKEHVYRKHALPIHCRRCNEIFENEVSLTAHSKKVISCLPAACNELEGFNKDQERQLKTKRKVPHASEAEKWIYIFKILFPQHPADQIPSPYCDFSQCNFDHLTKFKDYMNQELPERLQQSFPQLSEHDGELQSHSDSLLRIRAIVQQATEDIIQTYSLQVRETNANSHQPQSKGKSKSNVGEVSDLNSLMETAAQQNTMLGNLAATEDMSNRILNWNSEAPAINLPLNFDFDQYALDEFMDGFSSGLSSNSNEASDPPHAVEATTDDQGVISSLAEDESRTLLDQDPEQDSDSWFHVTSYPSDRGS